MCFQSGYFVFRKELVTRTSERFANNFIVLRNYEGDDVPHAVRVFSHSFKTNFFVRAVSNYNSLCGDFDLLAFSFNHLKKILQLLRYDREGLVVLV